METASDLAEAVEIRGITGMIERVLPGAHDVSTKSPVTITQHAGAPGLRRGLSHAQLAITKFLPPFELMNGTKSQSPDDVAHIFGNNELRSASAAPTRQCRNRAKRRPMQVIEVRMAYEY